MPLSLQVLRYYLSVVDLHQQEPCSPSLKRPNSESNFRQYILLAASSCWFARTVLVPLGACQARLAESYGVATDFAGMNIFKTILYRCDITQTYQRKGSYHDVMAGRKYILHQN